MFQLTAHLSECVYKIILQLILLLFGMHFIQQIKTKLREIEKKTAKERRKEEKIGGRETAISMEIDRERERGRKRTIKSETHKWNPLLNHLGFNMPITL